MPAVSVQKPQDDETIAVADGWMDGWIFVAYLNKKTPDLRQIPGSAALMKWKTVRPWKVTGKSMEKLSLKTAFCTKRKFIFQPTSYFSGASYVKLWGCIIAKPEYFGHFLGQDSLINCQVWGDQPAIWDDHILTKTQPPILGLSEGSPQPPRWTNRNPKGWMDLLSSDLHPGRLTARNLEMMLWWWFSEIPGVKTPLRLERGENSRGENSFWCLFFSASKPCPSTSNLGFWPIPSPWSPLFDQSAVHGPGSSVQFVVSFRFQPRWKTPGEWGFWASIGVLQCDGAHIGTIHASDHGSRFQNSRELQCPVQCCRELIWATRKPSFHLVVQ